MASPDTLKPSSVTFSKPVSMTSLPGICAFIGDAIQNRPQFNDMETAFYITVDSQENDGYETPARPTGGEKSHLYDYGNFRNTIFSSESGLDDDHGKDNEIYVGENDEVDDVFENDPHDIDNDSDGCSFRSYNSASCFPSDSIGNDDRAPLSPCPPFFLEEKSSSNHQIDKEQSTKVRRGEEESSRVSSPSHHPCQLGDCSDDEGLYETDKKKLTNLEEGSGCLRNPYGKKFDWILVFLIVFASSVSIIVCVIVLAEIIQDDEQIGSGNIKVTFPCDDLTDLYPVAALHKYNDDVTNGRFKAAGIRRVKEEGKNTISCEVSLTSVMSEMGRDEYNVIEGQVKLKPNMKGLTLGYSNYNLSVTHADLRGVSHDPQALIIETEGDYFVYFGIELVYGQNSLCRDLRHRTSITHLLIQEKSVHLPKALIASEHTCCESCDTESTTDFTGGLFHLRRNDRLFIQVSSPRNVGTSGANYLGVFRMTAH